MSDQILRDSHNKVLGKIVQSGNRTTLYDSYNHMLGYFDGKYTFDNNNKRVGEGNLLTMLLK